MEGIIIHFVEVRINEKWKMLEYPGILSSIYYISSYGRVYSTIKKRLLVSANHIQGYKHITLKNKNGRYTKVLVHRLVAYNFIKSVDDKKFVVNHIDGCKVNNYYKNLEWVTYSENSKHAYMNNLIKKQKPFKGETHPSIKYSDIFVEDICKNLEMGKLPQVLTLHLIDKYPYMNLSYNTLYRYIKTKIKSRISRTYITNKYKF